MPRRTRAPWPIVVVAVGWALTGIAGYVAHERTVARLEQQAVDLHDRIARMETSIHELETWLRRPPP